MFVVNFIYNKVSKIIKYSESKFSFRPGITYEIHPGKAIFYCDSNKPFDMEFDSDIYLTHLKKPFLILVKVKMS